jgi:hypothetical protein
MQYTGRLLGTEYGEVKELFPQLSFECKVGARTLTAKVIAVLKHPLNFIYRIAFSDGYTSDFLNNGGYWFDMANEKDYKGNKKSTLYIFSIKTDLDSFFGFEHSKEYYCFRLPINGEQTNVFVMYNEAETIPGYSVHYKGDYRFTLAKDKKGVWNAGSIRKVDPEKIDNDLARNISLMIESKQ